MPKRDSRGTRTHSKPSQPHLGGTSDWQAEIISRLRRLIEEADPESVEQQKWKKPSNPEGVPVWYHDGIVCVVGELKNRVRLTFPYGSSLNDAKGVFNACLGAGSMRAIDIHEHDKVDAPAIKSLIRAAVALNKSEASARG
jgi:hypothetical protein